MELEFLDVSGDAGIRVSGKTLEEAFAAAGIGAYELITDTAEVEKISHVTVDVKADSPETLLVRYLNELIFRFDTYGFVASHIVIRRMSPSEADMGGGAHPKVEWHLTADAYGEEFDKERHEQRALIKAATYHALKMERSGGGWMIEVVFDI